MSYKAIYNNIKGSTQNIINNALNSENTSSPNDINEKELINNELFNRAAKKLFEKSIEQVESLVEKYISSIDPYEILDKQNAKIIIDDIEIKLKKGNIQNKEIYIKQLAIIYFNIENFNKTIFYIDKMCNAEEKKRFKSGIDIIKLKRDDFINWYDKYEDFFVSLNLYTIFRKYSDFCLDKQDYQKAKKTIELCCSLNPTSYKDQYDLYVCYQMLKESGNLALQQRILNLIKR